MAAGKEVWCDQPFHEEDGTSCFLGAVYPEGFSIRWDRDGCATHTCSLAKFDDTDFILKAASHVPQLLRKIEEKIRHRTADLDRLQRAAGVHPIARSRGC